MDGGALMLPKPEIPCHNCVLYGNGKGYVPCEWGGSSGVLVILEAAGEAEEKAGIPTIGKAGGILWQNLARVDLNRSDFSIHNVLSCRPFNNKLAGMSYEDEAIKTCSPLLDATITEHVRRCQEFGKHPTILALGNIAFKRLLGLDKRSPILKQDFYCYPFWSEAYKCFVVAAPHPAFIARGNSHLLPVVQFAAKRAVEIAEQGLPQEEPKYLIDPSSITFAQWSADYFKELEAHPNDTYLSYDIETPFKQGRNEEEIDEEENADYIILRCSFAYRPNEAVSVPWRAEFFPIIEQLFGSSGPKVGWNSSAYDDPRIQAQMPINGDRLDGMLAWHVLNSALPKGLGFVSIYYAPNTNLWKHLSDSQPALYNAKDADMALRCFLGIKRDLIKANQWPVFERHIVQLDKVLHYMSGQGVLRDEVLRAEAETKLSTLLDDVEVKMEAAVPQEARRLRVYKKCPKDVAGMVQVERSQEVKRCSMCQMVKPPKAHFKPTSARKHKLGLDNICEDGTVIASIEPVMLWAKPLEFKVSKVSLLNYQKALRQQAIVNRHENRITFDEDAIKQLIRKHPKDPLYPLIESHRSYQKLRGTYFGITQEDGTIRGGIRLGRDGRCHPEFSHNPSTLRLACPFFHTLPRSSEDELANMVRNMIVAAPGCVLQEFDYKAIEAVLTGYFCGSAEYIRLSKHGVHAFLTSHVIGKPADLKWSNDDLGQYFCELKKTHKREYNASKRMVHGTNYGMTPRKMVITEPETFGTEAEAKRIQDIYLNLFPMLPKWQFQVQLQADKDGFLRNPFSYVHRFNAVFSYKKEDGKWVRKQGPDSNKVLAFLPQSTAAGIIKEAMLRLYFERFEAAGQYLRLQVHDSLVSEVPLELIDSVKAVMKEEMEKEVPELRLPASYNLGNCLSIEVESKQGSRWGGLV
jgi:uracil-DNA glycosylase family 4